MQTQSWMTKQGLTMCCLQEKYITRKGTKYLIAKEGNKLLSKQKM